MKEIERRVFPDGKQIDEIISKLDGKGAEWHHGRRMMIDFSGSVANRERTVMVRSNDDNIEVVVKSGSATDSERNEGIVQINDSLSNTLRTLSLLGYSKGDYGLRTMQKCRLAGIEYSIRTVHRGADMNDVVGYNFEVELIDAKDIKILDEALAELGLSPATESETVAIFERFHSEAHIDFSYSESSALELESIHDNLMSS